MASQPIPNDAATTRDAISRTCTTGNILLTHTGTCRPLNICCTLCWKNKKVSCDHPPKWEDFCRVLRQPKKKAAGPDGVPPHLLSWLPVPLQHDIFLAITQVWDTEHIPPEWLNSRISMIYKQSRSGPYSPCSLPVQLKIFEVLLRASP